MTRNKSLCVIASSVMKQLLDEAEQALSSAHPDFLAELRPKESAGQVARRALRDFHHVLETGGEGVDWSNYSSLYYQHRYDPETSTKSLTMREGGNDAIRAIRAWIESHEAACEQIEVKRLGGPRLPSVLILICALAYVAQKKAEPEKETN